MQEERWRNEKWAVDLGTKTIFRILDRETLDGELVIYSGKQSNLAKNLHTLKEAEDIETFWGII
jgi:hypothetical protein